MSDVTPGPFDVSDPIEMDMGGLRFSASFRAPAGATLRVSAQVEGHWQELLRFDDFVEQPHFHVPAAADATMVDREVKGAPLEFFLTQLRGHLRELLVQGGYTEILDTVDVDAVTSNVDRVRQAMIDVVPDGYARVPGVGLQRVIST
ncbi:MAG: hypothetical protein M0Z30_21895 [Actinomycetota bacterium]|nr:hypothetical protein [Actinomycetota bacterium]